MTTAGLIAGSAATATAFARTSPSPPVRTFTVRRLGDSGPGTLRSAVSFANSRPRRSVTVINFAVRGVIRLTRSLPGIARTVILDGFSAPDYVAGGRPVVEVDFNDHRGFRFAGGSTGSQLRGLAIDHASGAGISLDANAITINANYIGLDLAGRPFGNHGDGIYASPRSNRDQLGRNDSLVSGAVANVISANGGSGIVLDGSSSDSVVANRIGTNAGGTRALGNRDGGLRLIDGARGNTIGGPVFVDSATGQVNDPTGDKGTKTPVFLVPPLGNLISANRGTGVLIASGSSQNLLEGNFVGTTADGDARLGNSGDGVAIIGANRNSLIGCKFRNNPFVYYNVVSANRGNGLRVTDSDGTVVQGNFFGIGANNTAVIGNSGDGILVDGTSANTQVGGVIPLGNAAAGNFRNGIEVAGRARGFTTFNTFGGLLPFKSAAPNHLNGLLVTSAGGNNLARTNVFSGNKGYGVVITGRAHGNVMFGSFIGTAINGRSALGNGRGGLLISGAARGNLIGFRRNLISGNAGNGVTLTGGTFANQIVRNFIGRSVLRRPLPNSGRPVVNRGSANIVRGNLVSG